MFRDDFALFFVNAAMENIGIKVPASGIAHNMDEVRALGDVLPFPRTTGSADF